MPLDIYLHKLLPVFALPVGLSLLLLIVGIFIRKRFIIVAAIAILWGSSTPVVSNSLFRNVERHAERIEASNAPSTDAIVVLSGGRISAPGAASISEWTDPDRFFAGVELLRAGKAPLLVFTGGWFPWNPAARSEGQLSLQLAQTLGVPADKMVTTGVVRNTEEEASAVSQLLRTGKYRLSVQRKHRVLLVTSAFHMSRAQRLFEHAGLEVVAFPVDFQVADGAALWVYDFLPNAQALAQTERALRELYGDWYYRIRLK